MKFRIFGVKKENHNSRFLIDNNDFLQFQSDEKSTQKSYIIKLSLLELIRITSSDSSIAKKIYN